jgi:membrane protease YdiL (CAAX protease family)
MNQDFPKNIFQSILLLLIFFFYSSLLVFVNRSFLDSKIDDNFIEIFSFPLGLILTLLTLRKINGEEKFNINFKFEYKNLFLLTIMFSTLVAGVFKPLLYLYRDFFSSNIEVIYPFKSFTFILSSIIVGPFVEEYVFRRIILHRLLTNHSISFSIFFSSILFGLIHVNPIQIVLSLILGVLLGYVYIKTKSFFKVFLLHSTYNLTILICSYVEYSNHGYYPASLALIALLVFCFSLYLIIKNGLYGSK